MNIRTMATPVLRCLILFTMLWSLQAAEGSASFHKNGVTVTATIHPVEGPEAEIQVRFAPDPAGSPLHLYSKDLTGDVGLATNVALPADSPLTVSGPLRADREPHLMDGLSVYPPGPVTLFLPVRLPTSADHAPRPATVLVSYMACSESSCLIPVQGAPLELLVPTVQVATSSAVPANTDAAALNQVITTSVQNAFNAERATTGTAIRNAVAAALTQERSDSSSAIRWRRVTTVAEVESALADAKRQGQAALLDFTGPSCVNCQQMAKTVFRLPAVIAAWNRAVAIEISTDPPHDELAAWQQARFQTQARPLYVHLSADGHEGRWSEVFAPTDHDTLARFLSFLAGGVGSDAGTGQGLWQFLLLAVAGGLFTLLMPCTYPMIPFTMNFFAKQAAGGRPILPLAAFYAAGIVGCFVGLGVLVTGVFGASLATLAGHPVTNLVIAVVFVAFGLALLGVWFLRLPAGLENALGGGRAGYVGALLMGLTFAVTAFTCTAPFAGTVLAQAVATGAWSRPILGMTVYALAIAVPFFALALSPGMMSRLPRAGAWMNEFKAVGGVIELAAALKFLAICDVAWNWGVVGRGTVLAWWSASALIIAIYVTGWIRLPGDAKITEAGPWRLLTALAFLALGLWLVAGLAGTNLGIIESFFPADAAP